MGQYNVVGVVIYNHTLKCPDLPLEAMGLFLLASLSFHKHFQKTL